MKCKFILFLFVMMFVTSCASMYVPPSNDPKAKLGVNNQKFWTNQTRVFIFDDPITCKGLHVFSGLRGSMSSKPMPISANRFITISSTTMSFGYQPVNIVVTFYANESDVYLINTEKYGNGELKFNILKAINDISGQIKYTSVPFVKRELKSDILTGLDTICTDKLIQEKLKEGKVSLEKMGLTKQKEMLPQSSAAILLPMTIAA